MKTMLDLYKYSNTKVIFQWTVSLQVIPKLLLNLDVF